MNIKNGCSLLYNISLAAENYADRTALVIEQKEFSYRELFSLSTKIYNRLIYIKDSVVGIAAENKIETYASIIASLFAGKTYVMLHPDYPKERNLRIVCSANIGCYLFTDDSENLLDSSLSLIRINTLSLWHHEDQKNGDLQIPAIIDSNNNAYIIFTSGSTGNPKGVPISRDNLDAFYKAYHNLGWKLNENDRMLQMFELTFDVSIVSFLYPLSIGASIYTVSSVGFKYLNTLSTMDSYELTFAAIAPSVLRLARSYFSGIILPKLKYLIVTAEASDIQLLSDFRPCIPNAEIVNLYGPSEATIYCTHYPVPKINCKAHNGIVAIGKPFEGIKIIIANEHGNPQPLNTKGELWISGYQVFKGYREDISNTNSCFTISPNGELFYKTGDICSLDGDGDLIYYGRKDSQIKIQGFRIELSEIEYQAKEFYKHTCNAVVLPINNMNGISELHLFIESTPDKDSHELSSFLQRTLPSYMVPKHIHFIPTFPLNTNNKTDRKRMLELFLNLNNESEYETR